MSMPGNYTFAIPRGKTFNLSFRKLAGTPATAIDLTGWKVRGQIRTLPGQFGTSTTATLVLALIEGTHLEIADPTDGLVTLTLTSEDTESLAPGNVKIRLAYEIELYNDSDSPETVDGLVAGKINVMPETAR